MQILVEKLLKSKVSVRVELTPSEMLPHLTAVATRLSSRTSFPGFRPGKVPYDVVVKRIGEASVWEEALEDAVRHSFVAAVKEHNLMTVGQPEIRVEKIAPGNPVVYTATVSLLPTVSMPLLESVKVDKHVEQVNDDEVTKTIEQLRKLIAEEKPVDRPATVGDKVEIDVDVSIDRIAIESGRTRKHPVVLGDGAFIPGFEDHVVGMSKDQSKEFALSFPKQYHAKNLAGKLATFKVTVHSIVERTLPSLDDAFAKRVARVDTVEKLREQIRKNLIGEHEEKAEREYEAKLIEEIVKRSAFGEIPDPLIDNETDRMLAEIRHDIEERGMKFADYLASMKKDEATLKKDLHQGALNRVKSTLVIREIARNQNVSVSEKEIDTEVQLAVESVNDEKRAEMMKGEEFRAYVETVLMNRKAIDFLKSKQQHI
ncbi:MAG: trigger factor [Candidatus Kerfeldbacteria bacterium]